MSTFTKSFNTAAGHQDGVQPAAAGRTLNRRHVVAAVMGNAFEFYDFTSYSFFSVYIAKAFFPSSDPYMSLLLSVAVFGVGFVTRPLGAVVLGRYSDRCGRRKAMLLTLCLMALGTIGLAATPSYASIGIAAPILIILSRLLQGLALGGEVGSVSAYLVECAPDHKRGFYGSWQLASQGLAALIAGIVGVILTLLIDHSAMQSWGWRVPFIIGVCLIPVAMRLRLSMPESLTEKHMNESAAQNLSFLQSLQGQWYSFFLAMMITMGATIPMFIGLYMTTYATAALHLGPAVSMSATVLFGLSNFAGSLIGGWLSDRTGRKPIIVAARLVLLILAWPGFYWLIHHPSLLSLSVVTICLGLLMSISGALGVVVGAEIFPARIRALALAASYAIGVAVFGGSTQAVITWILHLTGDKLSLVHYLIATGLISLWAVLKVPETRHMTVHK